MGNIFFSGMALIVAIDSFISSLDGVIDVVKRRFIK